MKKNNPFYDLSLRKRHNSSKRFQKFTFASLILSLSFLAFFLFDITSKGIPAFTATHVKIDVTFNATTIENSRLSVNKDYRNIVSRAWLRNLPTYIKEHPDYMNSTQNIWVLADNKVDQYIKNHKNNLKEKDKIIINILKEQGLVEKKFNKIFFQNGDSKIPEYAGIFSALIGSILTLCATMLVAFPIGVMSAIYLEEFSSDNKFTRLIEININNLAAIPSILFGLLGLSIFINLFGVPRSSPLAGGLTLALMTLPIIIVSSRAALKAVPDNIKQAGYAIGLSKIQVTKDHVLPLAFPGILTGSIIGLAQAMGETAPLIIIGMVAFVPDAPSMITQSATIMPAQIFTWAAMPEGMYIEKTAAGILVLLSILISLNMIAIYLRQKFEVKQQG